MINEKTPPPDGAALAPCPFCGGEAEYDNADHYSGGEWVGCKDCGARVHAAYSADAKAETNWNRRASLATPGTPTLDLRRLRDWHLEVCGPTGPGCACPLKPLLEASGETQTAAAPAGHLDVIGAKAEGSTPESSPAELLAHAYSVCDMRADEIVGLRQKVESLEAAVRGAEKVTHRLLAETSKLEADNKALRREVAEAYGKYEGAVCDIDAEKRKRLTAEAQLRSQEGGREFWITEDAKTGQLMATAWAKPSEWICDNPAFKVSRWREAGASQEGGAGA
jgi:Lar family restriction alleviation protein